MTSLIVNRNLSFDNLTLISGEEGSKGLVTYKTETGIIIRTVTVANVEIVDTPNHVYMEGMIQQGCTLEELLEQLPKE